jgi:hypothetical protein
MRRAATAAPAVVVAAMGFVLIATALASGGTTTPATVTVNGTVVTPPTPSNDIVTASESMDFAGTSWTVERRESDVGPCIGVSAVTAATNEGTVGGGCGEPASDGFRWGIGGIGIQGQWYGVAYGQITLAGASEVDVTLRDGTVLRDANLAASEGMWELLYKGDPADAARDVIDIAVLDGSGASLAAAKPPSLSEAQSQETQAANGTAAG